MGHRYQSTGDEIVKRVIATLLTSITIASAFAVPHEANNNPGASGSLRSTQEATPILLTARQKVVEEYKEELTKQKKDSKGCMWRPEDFAKAEKNPDFQKRMEKICEAEKLAFDKANAIRRAFCKDDLILDQRLAYVSRQNAIRYIGASDNDRADAHAAWKASTVQNWFADFFPAAKKVIKFERENFGMTGGTISGSYTADKIASDIVGMWRDSGGHKAPIIHCGNRYAGVGIYFDEKRNEWISYMSFGELQSY